MVVVSVSFLELKTRQEFMMTASQSLTWFALLSLILMVYLPDRKCVRKDWRPRVLFDSKWARVALCHDKLKYSRSSREGWIRYFFRNTSRSHSCCFTKMSWGQQRMKTHHQHEICYKLSISHKRSEYISRRERILHSLMIPCDDLKKCTLITFWLKLSLRLNEWLLVMTFMTIHVLEYCSVSQWRRFKKTKQDAFTSCSYFSTLLCLRETEHSKKVIKLSQLYPLTHS